MSASWQSRSALLVGCGSIGRRHARVLASLGVEDLRVFDPNEAQLRQLLEETPSAVPVTSFEEGLAGRPDTVFVLTPLKTHIPLATVAVHAGCHVFCEKPLSMADPDRADTFKQGMNAYHSAKVGLYSEQTDEMHTILFGGISLQYYDRETEQFVTDDFLPFINQITSVVIDASGTYRQHLLPVEFPVITDDSSQRLRFGTNAEFMLAQHIETFANDIVQMDRLVMPTTIGYIYGGLMADSGNFGNTAVSNFVFEVLIAPEPTTWLCLVVGIGVGLGQERGGAAETGHCRSQ